MRFRLMLVLALLVASCTDGPDCLVTMCPHPAGADSNDQCARECPSTLFECVVDSDCAVTDRYCCSDESPGVPLSIAASSVQQYDGFRQYECSEGPSRVYFNGASDCSGDCASECRAGLIPVCRSGRCLLDEGSHLGFVDCVSACKSP